MMATRKRARMALLRGLLAACGLAAMTWSGHAGPVRIELAESGRHLRAGQAFSREAVLTHDGAATETVRMVWALAVGQATVTSGALSATAPPGRPVHVTLQLRAPSASRIVQARLGLLVRTAAGERARTEAALRVYPERQALPWAFLGERRLGVFDPAGALAARLRILGGRPEVIGSLEAAAGFSGELLILGEECVATLQAWDEFRAALRRRTRPLAVVALHQGLGVKGRGGAGEWADVAICLPRHPALRLLEPEDLNGWSGAGVALSPWLTPLPGVEARRLLRPLTVGEDAPGAALLEESLGEAGGTLLRCQIPLLERWEREPACEPLLNAVLRGALQERPKGSKGPRRTGASPLHEL